MATFKQFSKRIRIIGDGIPEKVNKLVKRVALVVDQALVTSTPVDTGAARSNWVVRINEPNQGTIDPYVSGSGGSSGNANAAAALEQGKRVILPRKNEQEIHITNNLPYIKRLNNGHSAQAPAGFVQMAVTVGVKTARQGRIL